MTGEQIAADLEVSAATRYNWRRQYSDMDADAARELKELREQNARLKSRWLTQSWRKTRCGRSARENSRHGGQPGAIDVLRDMRTVSGRFACKLVGLTPPITGAGLADTGRADTGRTPIPGEEPVARLRRQEYVSRIP
ncbi:transposase [Nocardia sp. X0981]